MLITSVPTRWRKVIRDIWQNRVRTLLVVLAIAVGVFAFGGMFITRDVLLKNMNQGFAATNPATIGLTLSPFDDSLVRTARNFPFVAEVDARTSAQIDAWTGENWSFLTLYASEDFGEDEINVIESEQGNLEPGRREVLLERQSLAQIPGPDSCAHRIDVFCLDTQIEPGKPLMLPRYSPAPTAQVGDILTIELPDGSDHELVIAGVVHDFNAVPASTIPILTGYVSLGTMRLLELSDNYTELRIVTPPEIDTQAELEFAADELIDRLDRYGYSVSAVELTEPGKHWASDFIDALVLVLLVLGLLALGLSGFLVVNTITAILAQQKRQVGMMKAVGARNNDVMGIYLAMSGVYGLLSLLVALPMGIALSRGMIFALADFLNINVMSFEVPSWILGIQIATALVAPLIAAYIPVAAGSRTTVREAVSDYGISDSMQGGLIDRITGAIRGLPRPTLLSIRNTLRRKGRLLITLLTLAIAGAIFIAVLNTRTSILGEFSQVLDMFGYDVQVVMLEPQIASRLKREASEVDGVTSVEGWAFASGTIIRPDGVVVEDDAGFQQSGPGGGGPPGTAISTEEGTEITIFAPPPDSRFLDPTIIDGRWLQPGDKDVIVIASEVLNTEPYIKVGDMIKIDFGDRKRDMEVIGIVSLVGPEFGYAPFDTISRYQGAPGFALAAMLGTTEHQTTFQEAVARAVEERFQDQGMPVIMSATPSSFIGIFSSMIDYFVAFMIFMALLLGLVGGLGLTTTMSLNVLERTREIGVMRSIGASDGAVRGVFMTEGLLIGIMSAILAAILSVPVTIGFAIGVGQAFFSRPLGLAFPLYPFIAWFIIALFVAALATFFPANRAAQVSVRESLAYE